MAPAAAVAYSIYISVPDARQALPLSVLLALVACICAATAIGQLAKHFPSAGGMYTYAARSLGPTAGFLVAWLFIMFEPLVAPFLYLEFGWAMSEVFENSVGWHYDGQWWIWVLLMTVIVFLLTYRDVRISTTAGVILGAFEIAIFAGLAIWMLLSNAGDMNLQPFNPGNAEGEWSGVFKGMVFAILAFIGFEAAAPLGEEARNPRRNIPRAVVGSAVAIGLFYVLCSYAWVFGAGFDGFVEQATGADPWRNLGEVFWGTGRILVFLAICNSIAANSNAAVNAATRVFYALARNGLAPKPLASTHPEFKTPHVAIIWMSGFALVLALAFGAIWDPLTGFAMIATMAVPVVILVYMIVSVGCIGYYLASGAASSTRSSTWCCRWPGSSCSSSRSTTSSTRRHRPIRSRPRTGSRWCGWCSGSRWPSGSPAGGATGCATWSASTSRTRPSPDRAGTAASQARPSRAAPYSPRR